MIAGVDFPISWKICVAKYVYKTTATESLKLVFNSAQAIFHNICDVQRVKIER